MRSKLWYLMKRRLRGLFAVIFKVFFTSTQPSVIDMNAVLDKILQKATEEMNEILATPFTETKVYKAFQQF